LPRRAHSFLDRLNDQTKESVQLAIMQDTNLVHILRRESRHAVRVDAGLGGNAAAAHATATGKAILAWLPPNELDRIVADKGLTAFTPHTITGIEALKEEMRLTRRRGYSIDREEFRPGVICLGAAIRDHAGAVVGAISVSCPAFRATEEYIDQLRVHLVTAADELSAELGAPGAILQGPAKSMAAE
jgi:IclR family acetate operon transcriptional repressor